MNSSFPLTRDLVFIGGGHAHALVLRKWGMAPVAGVRVTVINPDPTAPYTGMLPGFVAGHYDRDDLEIDLVRLARFAGARMVMGRATGVDRAAGVVHVDGHADIRYDHLSIDVGITSDMPRLPGFMEHAIAAKPLGRYADEWSGFQARARAIGRPVNVAVLGAGVAGCELALAMQHRLAEQGVEAMVRVIDKGPALDGIGGAVRATLFEQMRAADIRAIDNTAISHVTADAVHLDTGTVVPSDFTVGAAGARPHEWVAEMGLEHQGGYLSVDRFLRSVSDPAIYAVGDCANMVDTPRPKAGVFAVRQAPVLYRNLVADLTGTARKPFRPQRDFLKLISMGGKQATAEYYGMGLKGAWMWRWKDQIDRKFMDQFDAYPVMGAPPAPALRVHGEAPDAAMMCGGCGSKIGQPALRRGLDAIPAPERDDVVSLPGDDAAILAMESDWQVVTTDHLRGFTLDPVRQARIAAVHALGDVWAMGARPQAAVASVILPVMSPQMQGATLHDILAAASDVFRAEGAELVGGHSSQGSEMTIGFTVTGLSETYPVTVGGAKPGAALILTKPIGSGVIMAAEMRSLARGPDVMAALDMMDRSQGAAAEILAPVAQAMTDVTGFGLAGHVANMCRDSGVGARIDITKVPVMDGALELSAAGIGSTLLPDNLAALAEVCTLADTPKARLLADPQTAGGLLACVPAAQVSEVLEALQAAGYPAVQIGEVTEAPVKVTVTQ
jgi:selenide,water dikinase